MNHTLDQLFQRQPAPRTLARDRRGRPRLYRLQTELIADTLAAPEPQTAAKDNAPRKPKQLHRVTDELADVRANVQDAAAAVLAWLSSVLAHDDNADLDDILRRCLRPSDDCKDVNYAALAEQVRAVTGITLTAKRVQTAVRHLRKAHARKPAATPPSTVAATFKRTDPLRDKLAELHARLRTQHALLHSNNTDPLALDAQRQAGTLLLSAVRAAAGKVIDRGFGEHLAEQLDTVALEAHYLAFLRDQSRAGRRDTLQHNANLQPLALLLTRFDGSAHHHVQLVTLGSSIVQTLLGPDSLPGLLAQLNVRVVGRSLLDTHTYVADMLRIADAADALHDDEATQRYLRFARRLPEDQRVPAARRIASYARSNAATRLYDRLYSAELAPDALTLADHALATMMERDSGFILTLTTELVAATVHAHLTQTTTRIDALLTRLGPDKSLERLEALLKFDNNDALVQQARQHLERVHPQLHQALLIY